MRNFTIKSAKIDMFATRNATRKLCIINSSLQDSSSGESFNFGSLNGVRGFYTNPSKADDSFVPFKSSSKIIETEVNIPTSYSQTATIDISSLYDDYKNITVDNILLALPQNKIWVHGNGFGYTYHYTYDNQKGIITMSGSGTSAFSKADNIKAYINVIII